MRCVVEVVFSGTKRRFGEYLFSIKTTKTKPYQTHPEYEWYHLH